MVQMRPVIPTPNFPTNNGEKLPKKIPKNGHNDPKMAQNGLKCPKNSPKLSAMFRQMVQMRPVIQRPNLPTENSEKLPKNDQNSPKMA